MVVSRDTTLSIYLIFEQHLSEQQMDLVLGDLLEVPGNRSFRDTIERLLYLHKLRRAKVKRNENHCNS
jgi:hypothetical protein